MSLELRRSLSALALPLCLLAPSADAQNCAGDPGFEILINPPVVAIGETFEECLVTPPGDWTALLILSLNPGSIPTIAGELCLGLPWVDIFPFPMPPDGLLCLGSRTLPCDPFLIGATGYFQFVGVSPSHPGVFGVSNMATLTVTDGPCNHPCEAMSGDFVFIDLDRDNLQDANEPGIPGVDLILKDANGFVIATTTTDANGHYLFTGLCAGAYTVEVDASTVPAGLRPVQCDVGGDDAIDSDCSPATVVLTDNDSADLTVDFGYDQDCEIGSRDFVTFTQGGWGTECSGGNPGCLRDAHFAAVFPAGLVIGDQDGPDGDGFHALLLTTSQAVEDFLPAGGTSGVLDRDETDVTSTSAGVFAGQLVAATLSVAFDDAGVFDFMKDQTATKLGDLYFISGVHSKLIGLTVDELLGFANGAISGELPVPVDVNGDSIGDVSLSQLNTALDKLNKCFVDGNTYTGVLGPCQP